MMMTFDIAERSPNAAPCAVRLLSEVLYAATLGYSSHIPSKAGNLRWLALAHRSMATGLNAKNFSQGALFMGYPLNSNGQKKSAGHVIVDTLVAHGVERVYSAPGESYLDVLDGLADSPIKNIVCRHEGGATYMAEADGKLNQIPGVAMVTRGPGAANAHVALHTAWQDSTAMVLF